MRTFSLIVTVTSLFLLFSVLSSSAAPINNWTFGIQYGFTEYNDGVDGLIPNPNFNNLPTKLKWGAKGKISGDYYSSSTIYASPGSINSTIELGEQKPGITLTHENNIISDKRYTYEYYLETATLSSRLTITPDGFPQSSWEKDFDIKFYETPNNSNHPSDIFMVSGFGSLEEIIEIGGYSYKATFGVDFDELTSDQKTLLGLDNSSDYFGFITPEEQLTHKKSWFSIETVSYPTPEPTTLVLFGLGLVGLAGIVRKKIKL